MSSSIKQEFLHSMEFSGAREAPCIHLLLGWIFGMPQLGLLEVGSGSHPSRDHSRALRSPKLPGSSRDGSNPAQWESWYPWHWKWNQWSHCLRDGWNSVPRGSGDGRGLGYRQPGRLFLLTLNLWDKRPLSLALPTCSDPTPSLCLNLWISRCCIHVF